MEAGGQVLYLIAAATFVMWALIFERAWYLRKDHLEDVGAALAYWEGRKERSSWNARMIRQGLISEVNTKLTANMGFIKTLISLLPLLGLPMGASLFLSRFVPSPFDIRAIVEHVEELVHEFCSRFAHDVGEFAFALSSQSCSVEVVLHESNNVLGKRVRFRLAVWANGATYPLPKRRDFVLVQTHALLPSSQPLCLA